MIFHGQYYDLALTAANTLLWLGLAGSLAISAYAVPRWRRRDAARRAVRALPPCDNYGRPVTS